MEGHVSGDRRIDQHRRRARGGTDRSSVGPDHGAHHGPFDRTLDARADARAAIHGRGGGRGTRGVRCRGSWRRGRILAGATRTATRHANSTARGLLQPLTHANPFITWPLSHPTLDTSERLVAEPEDAPWRALWLEPGEAAADPPNERPAAKGHDATQHFGASPTRSPRPFALPRRTLLTTKVPLTSLRPSRTRIAWPRRRSAPPLLLCTLTRCSGLDLAPPRVHAIPSRSAEASCRRVEGCAPWA